MVLGCSSQEVCCLSLTGLSPSMAYRSRQIQLNNRFLTPRQIPKSARMSPATPSPQRLGAITWRWFGLFPVRSPLLRELQVSDPCRLETTGLLSFLRGTKMFQFPHLPSRPYGLGSGFPILVSGGLPHSGIPGSKAACAYPGRFAACRALLRLLSPEHPPYALCSLI